MAICTRCGKENDHTATQCAHCGKDLTSESAEMKCPKCSTRNPVDATSCKVCRLVFQAPPDKKAVAKPKVVVAHLTKPVPPPAVLESEKPAAPESPQTPWFCTWCGKEVSPRSSICVHCHRDLSTGSLVPEEPFSVSDYQPYQQPSSLQTYPETSAPLIAGLLLTLGGVFALGQGLVYMVANDPLGGIVLSSVGTKCCGAIILILGLCGIVGGKFASDRKHLIMVLVACISIMATFTFYVVGPLLGLFALLLVWISRSDFEPL